MPHGNIVRLVHVLSNNSGPLHMRVNDGGVHTRINSFVFASGLISNHFPSCHHILPGGPSGRLRTNYSLLGRTFTHTTVLSGRGFHNMHLCIDRGRLGVATGGPRRRRTRRVLSIACDNTRVRVNFGIDCILSILGTLGYRGIHVVLASSISDIRVRSTTSRSTTCIIVPVELWYPSPTY